MFQIAATRAAAQRCSRRAASPAGARRRLRLAHYLLGWGDRVLESVFECVWRADQMPRITLELRRLIDPATDRLWLVPVCRRCRSGALVNGRHRAVDHPGHHVV